MLEKIKVGNQLEGVLEGTAVNGAVLISHGAGGNMDTSLLLNTASQLSNAGFLTLRWNFGYVSTRRAPSAGGRRELPELVAMLDYLTERAGGKPIILLGKSFGGRLSTYVVPTRNDVAGLVLYGLPIQGIGSNPKPRDWSHLSKISAKMLFITGDKDKLCPLEQLALVQEEIRHPFTSEVVPGDHSYKPRGEEVALRKCVEWLTREFGAKIEP